MYWLFFGLLGSSGVLMTVGLLSGDWRVGLKFFIAGLVTLLIALAIAFGRATMS